MNAMEKVAWTELGVSVAAVAAVCLLFPWFGSRATSAFALLALVVLGAAFLRRRGERVVVDERDQAIQRKATSIAVGTTWFLLVATLATAGTWANYSGAHTVSTTFLNWLIWIQFAALYGLHGLASVVMYRRQRHAA